MSEHNDKNSVRYVVFKVGVEIYSLDISKVHEIIKMQDVTGIPDIKEYISGVINLRGKIIPVISLRKRLDIGEGTDGKKTRIIIVGMDDYEVGLVVDEVCRVIAAGPDSMEPVTDEMSRKGERFLESVIRAKDGIVGVLNLEEVLEVAGMV